MLGGCRGLFSLYQLAGVLFAKPYLSAVGAGGEGEKESLRAAAKPGDVHPGGCVSVRLLGWVPMVSDASVSCSPSPGGSWLAHGQRPGVPVLSPPDFSPPPLPRLLAGLQRAAARLDGPSVVAQFVLGWKLSLKRDEHFHRVAALPGRFLCFR